MSKKDIFFYDFDMSSQKDVVRAIKVFEFIVRKSMSYNIWQKRSKIPINECPVCNTDFNFIKAETHHHPETLFDIVSKIIESHIDKNDLDDFTDFDICQEIMNLHTTKKVDYIVLCKHCHDKYHSDLPEVVEVMDELQKIQAKEIKENFFKEKI